MRSAIRSALAVAVVAMITSSAFAALSSQYADFGKGPAQFLMTKEEQAKWKTITTDDEAKAFIDLFWFRRDPTPNTPANEFKAVFEQRVKFCDERFGTRRVQGSMTDRGRVVILLGTPTEQVKQEKMPASPLVPGPGGTSSETPMTEDIAGGATGAGLTATQGVRQIWTYSADKAKQLAPSVLNGATVQIPFVDPRGINDFSLERTRQSNEIAALLDRAAQSYITQPNATEVPKTPPPAVAQQKPAAPAATSTTIKTAALQAAIDELKAGRSAIAKDASVACVELVSPAGEYYVPVQLYIGKAAGLGADAADTFFGAVEDSTGKVVTAFEEPAKLIASRSDFFVDKTLTLPGGKYTAVLGLAKAGTPVKVASKTLELTEVAKDAVGTSKMLLSNNIYETPSAAPVKSPFAFGRLKVVPNGSLLFGNKDELSYFVELHNPGIDPATNLPKIQTKLELSGGKLTRPITAPLSDTPALPLSGAVGPGQYAIISSIPLGEMSKPLDPGDYILKMKLIDTISKQTYNLEQSFKIGS